MSETDPRDYDARMEELADDVKMSMAGLHNLAQIYHSTFSTELGAKVLADLDRCYDGSTVGSSARTTEILSAQREVLMRIKDLIEIARENPESLVLDRVLVEILFNPRTKYENQ